MNEERMYTSITVDFVIGKRKIFMPIKIVNQCLDADALSGISECGAQHFCAKDTINDAADLKFRTNKNKMER